MASAGKAAWCIPYPSRGQGGIRTILQNATRLQARGWQCDLYVSPNSTDVVNPPSIIKAVKEWYGFNPDGVYPAVEPRDSYDAVIATAWNTAEFASYMCSTAASKTAKGFYFVQDLEQWFYPEGGDTSVRVERTYDLGLQPITIGRWLSKRMSQRTGLVVPYCDFGVNGEIYHRIEGTSREHAICAVCQPEKPRRMTETLLAAIRILTEVDPQLKVYLYGSNQAKLELLPMVTNLGIISLEECNALYNRCEAGLVLSSSNPSRIPFEMMSAGLPVVDLYRENNLYDMPDNAVALAEPTPDGIASAVLNVLEDSSRQAAMSKAGRLFAAGRTAHSESDAFCDAFEQVLAGGVNAEGSQGTVGTLFQSTSEPLRPQCVSIHDRMARTEMLQTCQQHMAVNISSCDLMLSMAEKAPKDASYLLAVWSKDNQSDLRWLPLEGNGDGTYRLDGLSFRRTRDQNAVRYFLQVLQQTAERGDVPIATFVMFLQSDAVNAQHSRELVFDAATVRMIFHEPQSERGELAQVHVVLGDTVSFGEPVQGLYISKEDGFIGSETHLTVQAYGSDGASERTLRESVELFMREGSKGWSVLFDQPTTAVKLIKSAGQEVLEDLSIKPFVSTDELLEYAYPSVCNARDGMVLVTAGYHPVDHLLGDAMGRRMSPVVVCTGKRADALVNACETLDVPYFFTSDLGTPEEDPCDSRRSSYKLLSWLYARGYSNALINTTFEKGFSGLCKEVGMRVVFKPSLDANQITGNIRLFGEQPESVRSAAMFADKIIFITNAEKDCVHEYVHGISGNVVTMEDLRPYEMFNGLEECIPPQRAQELLADQKRPSESDQAKAASDTADMRMLTPSFCKTIPRKKANAVITTVLGDNVNQELDTYLLDALKRSYDKVIVWPYGAHDYRLCLDRVADPTEYRILSPTLEALDEALAQADIEYVGLRPDVGIRALCKGCRSLIITADKHARSMADTYNLPHLERNEIVKKLERTIRRPIVTRVKVPADNRGR